MSWFFKNKFALIPFLCKGKRGQFCCVVLPGLCCSVLMHVWCWLPSPQRRGRGAGEDHHNNTRNIRSKDSSISPLPIGLLMVLLFYCPVLEIISYCCFILLSFFFPFCCCSDETFFWCWSCSLCSATAALHSAFCCRVFWGVEEKTRDVWVVLQGSGSQPGGLAGGIPQWIVVLHLGRDWNNKLLILLCVDMMLRRWILLNVVITTFHSATIKKKSGNYWRDFTDILYRY